MEKREIYVTPYGEMIDMINCMAIDNGAARPKRKAKRITSFDEVIKLR